MLFKSANLALRFLLEVCAPVALGYWGAHTGRGLLPLRCGQPGARVWPLPSAWRWWSTAS